MLPAVGPSSGPTPVCAGSIRIASGATSSSSAAICTSAVRMPWPSSTLPIRRATVPSAATCSHEERRGLATRSFGASVIRRSRPARTTAAIIRRWMPQRHRCRSSAAATVASSGCGCSASSAAALTTRPETQKPHWAACSSRTACWTGCRRPPSASPSTVVTDLPSTDQTGVSHAGTALPSTRTTHAPHWPMPQPNRAPVSPRSPRSTSSSGVSGCASTCRDVPLTVRSTVTCRRRRAARPGCRRGSAPARRRPDPGRRPATAPAPARP